MKKVLIVDDEKSFLLSLEAGLKQYAQEFTTVTAENGKVAVTILKDTKIDLVVTDLNMPEMDGFQLLALMTKSYPHIPVIISTAYTTPAIKNRVEILGSFRIQEKPINFKELAENILSSLKAMDSSYLRGVTLPAFLQLVEMERKTCTLKIISKNMSGFLCFRDGELLDATTNVERGESAAYDIISWDDVEIEINSICKVKSNHIGKGLSHVLMEGFRLKDERKRAAKAGGQEKPAKVEQAISISPKAPEAPARQKPEGANGKEAPNEREDKMASINRILDELAKPAKVERPNSVTPIPQARPRADSITPVPQPHARPKADSILPVPQARPKPDSISPVVQATAEPVGQRGVSNEREDEMTSIKGILNEFTKLQGVSAVCLVGRDGFLLESIAHSGIDTEMIGAIASSGYGASESMGKQLGKGTMSISMSEFEDGPVMSSPVGEDSLLVIIAEREANLGMIRLKLKKHVHELATAAAL